MDQIEPSLGPLIPVCMELPLRVGSVDNLFVTPEGNLVMVEVKLWGNPEARRTVVAQALDYATELFKLTYGELEAAVGKGDFNGAQRLNDSTASSPAPMPHRRACSRTAFRAICAQGRSSC